MGVQAERRKYHLIKLASISLPTNMGDWGLIDLRSFRKALLCKSLWRAIQGEGPWSYMIQMKYLGRKSLQFWFKKGTIGASYASPIWLSFRRIELYFLKNLIWHFQTGSKILIGKDRFKCGAEELNIPEPLLNFFHRRGMFYWDSLIAGWQGPIPLWKEAVDLQMPQEIAHQWVRIRTGLQNCGIFCSEDSDYLTWNISKEINVVRVKEVYQHMILKQIPCIPVFPQIF